MVRQLSSRISALVLLLGAASCGGGGADSSAVSVVPEPGSQGTETASPGSSTASSTASCGISDFAAAALARINAARSAGANCRTAGTFAPAPAVTWSNQLAQAAAAHTNDMVANRFFSHTGSDGSTLGSRVTAAGYSWRAVAENIAAGYGSIDSVVAGWLASDGHCANLMGASYTQIGMACATSSANGNNWTLDLAAPQ